MGKVEEKWANFSEEQKLELEKYHAAQLKMVFNSVTKIGMLKILVMLVKGF